MDILTLATSYGIVFVCSCFVTIFTNIFKDYIPQKTRPYLPLILALIFAPFTPMFLAELPTSVIMWVKVSAIDWCKIWAISILTYDLIIRLLKKNVTEDNDGSK